MKVTKNKLTYSLATMLFLMFAAGQSMACGLEPIPDSAQEPVVPAPVVPAPVVPTPVVPAPVSISGQ